MIERESHDYIIVDINVIALSMSSGMNHYRSEFVDHDDEQVLELL